MEKLFRIKETHPVLLLPDGKVKIGDESDFMSLAENPNGLFSDLLALLNGFHTLDQIVNQLRRTHADVTVDVVTNVLEQLDQNLHLEDAALIESDSGQIRHVANERYIRNFLDASTSATQIQTSISKIKTAIVGLGGLGSNILTQLIGLGFEHFYVIEPDVVEEKNFNRQFLYRTSDLGVSKLEAAKHNTHNMNPRISLEGVEAQIESLEHLRTLVPRDTDILICAADTPPIKIQQWTSRLAVEIGSLFVCGGIGVTQANFFSMVPTKTPCLDCTLEQQFLMESDGVLVSEAYQKMSFPNAAIAPTATVLAGLITNEIMKYLLGYPSDHLGTKVNVDFSSLDISPVDLPEISCQCGTVLRLQSLYQGRTDA